MKPARLVGFVSGLVSILCLAFLYTQRSYLYFIFPKPAYATGTAQFFGTKFLDVANTAYYLDPAATISLTVSGKIGVGTTAPGAAIESSDIILNGPKGIQLQGAAAPIQFTGTGPNQIITASGVNLALMPGGSGNVGIGTTNPSYELDVVGTSTTIRGNNTGASGYGVDGAATNGYGIHGSGNSGGYFSGTLDGVYITVNSGTAKALDTNQVNASGFNVFATGGINYMSTKLGIGTTNPGYAMDVVGDIQANGTTGLRLTGAGSDLTFTGAGPNQIITASGADLGIMPGGTGNVGIGTSSPSVKLDIVGNTYVRSGALYTDTIKHFNGGSTPLTIGTGYEIAILTNTGYVGIGTTAPNYKLHVAQDLAGEALIRFANTNAGGSDTLWMSNVNSTGDSKIVLESLNSGHRWTMGIAGSDYNFRIANNYSLATTPYFTITTVGNVGIGTTNANTKLQVVGLTSSQPGNTVCMNASGSFYYFAGSCVSSSIKNKTNVTDLPDQSDKIFQLRPVKFNYKDTGGADIGLIAEEVAPVLPDLIYYNNGEISGVKYDKLPIYLLQMTKKQQAQITSQQQQIDKLKTTVEEQGQTIRQLQTEVEQLKAQQ